MVRIRRGPQGHWPHHSSLVRPWLLLELLLSILFLTGSAALNPNLQYFGVWDAEKGCPGGAVEPQPHRNGYFHYPHVQIPTHQNRSACPAGDCAIRTVVVGSVTECETACNSTAKCVAVELADTPAGPQNCTLLYVGGPGVSDPTHDTYVATWAATHEHTSPPPNLACQMEQSKWMNFVFTSADPLVIKRYHRAGMGPALLHVRETFFCGNRLCADFKEKWAALLASTVRPMLQEKSLFGVFFGDEICWSCTSWENVSAAVDVVRADLPRGQAILYYNEAFPVLALNKCDTGGDFDPNQRTNFSYPRVPAGLDWISLDYYPDEGTLKGTPRLFQQHVYPKMAEYQKALFVPPAYGCHGDAACSNALCCSNSTRDGPNPPCNGDCSVAMLQWAKGCYDWARSDPRIVGLNPWHFTSNGENPPHSEFEPGLVGMPAVLAAYQAIGKEIISGKQRDVDFRRFGLFE